MKETLIKLITATILAFIVILMYTYWDTLVPKSMPTTPAAPSHRSTNPPSEHSNIEERPVVSPESASTIAIDNEIQDVVDKTFVYVNSQPYNSRIHNDLMARLQRLYAIKLNKTQNSRIEVSMKLIETKRKAYQATIDKKKEMQIKNKDEGVKTDDNGIKENDEPRDNKDRTLATHIVDEKETFFSISNMYGMTLKRLKKLNPDYKEKNPVIKKGDKLIVEIKN